MNEYISWVLPVFLLFLNPLVSTHLFPPPHKKLLSSWFICSQKYLRIDTSRKDGSSLRSKSPIPRVPTALIKRVTVLVSHFDKPICDLGPLRSSLTPGNFDLRPTHSLAIPLSLYLDLTSLILLLCVKPPPHMYKFYLRS